MKAASCWRGAIIHRFWRIGYVTGTEVLGLASDRVRLGGGPNLRCQHERTEILLSSWKNLTNTPIEPGTNNPTNRGETPDPVGHRSARWARAFTATACVALIVSGSVACGATNKTPFAKSVPAPGNAATTTTAATTATGVRHGIETLGLP
ncbi:MAG: hypothetical protein QOK39_898, partial [Acidimicrobiaceae bacterium]|nr:hypothetical protein [Acidimicrobiaceae bacterium]